MVDASELARLIEPVARHFFGDPNRRLCKPDDLRWGSNGSMSVKKSAGTWYDHEACEGGGTLDLIERQTGLHGGERFDWLKQYNFIRDDNGARGPRPSGSSRPIKDIYDYKDERDVLLFQAVRYDTDPKTFSQRQPDHSRPGHWLWNTTGVRLVPYRLKETLDAIAANRIVWIVEGEKDVNRLWSIGLASTTNPRGAGQWKSEFSYLFKDADVVVIPDNDPQSTNKETGALLFHPDGKPKFTGQDHARNICNSLASVAKRVRYLDLSEHWADMPLKGDVSDWLDNGGAAEELEKLAEKATVWLRVAASGQRKPKPTSGPQLTRQPWYADLRTDKKGYPFLDLRNVLIAMRLEPRLIDAFNFDEMAQDAKLMHELPAAPGAKVAPPPDRRITAEDITQLQEWLQECGMPRLGRETIAHAIDKRAREFRFHPVREWLDKLEWDGTRRIDTWLHDYLGVQIKDASHGKYVSAIGRMFLIAMVARIYDPGCKCDYMLVLEGEQGIMKSLACHVLAGVWFSDNLPDIHTKDAQQHLRGKWLIEVSELAAFTKADSEALKAFITRTEEKYRPPYGHEDVYEPRQCVFIGTTNRAVYVKDETGGRRFWPVTVGSIDIPGLMAAREQLFAEAVIRYDGGKGEHWWPAPEFEREHFRPQQDKRIEGDPWEEDIHKYVDGELDKPAQRDFSGGISPGKWPRVDRVTVTQVAREALGFDAVARVGTADQRRIASILQDMRWTREKDFKGRFYQRPAKDQAAPLQPGVGNDADEALANQPEVEF